MKPITMVLAGILALLIQTNAFATGAVVAAVVKGGNHRSSAAPSAPSASGAPKATSGKCEWECDVSTVTVFGQTEPSVIGANWRRIEGCGEGLRCEAPTARGNMAMGCRPAAEGQKVFTECR